MRGLYLRIASSAILAVVVAWLTVGFLASQFRSRFDPRAQGPGGGGPIGWIATQLEGLSEDQWPAKLAEAQREMAIPLSILRANALPDAAASQVTVPRPMLVDDGRGGRSMYVPLRGGAYYMVAASPAPPSPLPLVAGAAVFVCVLTLTTAALVGIPLVRRLQALRHAIVDLGNGNWSVRVAPSQGGVLGELAGSITRTASQLQRQFQEREALLQVASHEIGTPLSRMRFQLAMLEERLVSDRELERVRALSDDLDELDTLSTDLVAWMETDAGSRTAREVVELAPLLHLLGELEHSSAGECVHVVVRAPHDATAYVDQRQFQRAIENLLRNAFRYAHALVVVEVCVAEETVAVDVRDDGPGIPREQWTTVLEPFVRVDAAQTRAHRGLGLGLAIVRRIVDAHGGSITVTSAEEGGTCVRTVWPARMRSLQDVHHVPKSDRRPRHRAGDGKSVSPAG
jgi:two-component system, OmpR family, sensor kinase ParS